MKAQLATVRPMYWVLLAIAALAIAATQLTGGEDSAPATPATPPAPATAAQPTTGAAVAAAGGTATAVGQTPTDPLAEAIRLAERSAAPVPAPAASSFRGAAPITVVDDPFARGAKFSSAQASGQ
ncbi:hypothetical protein GKE82_23870 [Conexibacter sp. W3-3-2]|uniref:hypothetical protein n=1 Tax=Conexibacter sp. W3-3-2 TaxID=2675227 RepID=UPI0012B6B7DF|nr:hypothetical protein [Conexibacter sp. W3-3-2]MTD47245.1 hypothetical protein [Conexibacter sp. W3-3-2]